MPSIPSVCATILVVEPVGVGSMGVRLLSGVLLLALVGLLLAIPLVLALRSAAARRQETRRLPEARPDGVDAWRESARRMETPS